MPNPHAPAARSEGSRKRATAGSGLAAGAVRAALLPGLSGDAHYRAAVGRAAFHAWLCALAGSRAQRSGSRSCYQSKQSGVVGLKEVFVVGASRRSAAPGIQFVVRFATATYGPLRQRWWRGRFNSPFRHLPRIAGTGTVELLGRAPSSFKALRALRPLVKHVHGTLRVNA